MPTRRPPPPPPPPPLVVGSPPAAYDDDRDVDDDDAALPGPEIKVTTPAEPASRRRRPPPRPPSSASARSGYLRRQEPDLTSEGGGETELLIDDPELRDLFDDVESTLSSALTTTDANGRSESNAAATAASNAAHDQHHLIDDPELRDMIDDVESTLSSVAGHVDDDEAIARAALATSGQRGSGLGMGGVSPMFSSPKGGGRARGSGMLLVPDSSGGNGNSRRSASVVSGLSVSQRSAESSLSIDINEDVTTAPVAPAAPAPNARAARTVSRSLSTRSRSRSPTSLLRGNGLLRAASLSAGTPPAPAPARASVVSRAVSTGADETDLSDAAALLLTPPGRSRARSSGAVTPSSTGMKLRRASSAVVPLRSGSSASAGRLSLLGKKNNSSVLPVVSPGASALVTRSPSSQLVLAASSGSHNNTRSKKNAGGVMVRRPSRRLATRQCRGCSAKNCPARKRRTKYRRITHTVKLCFGNDLLSLALHILAFLVVLTVTLRSKSDVDRATAQLEHYRDEERRVNSKIREFENRASRLSGEVERLKLDNERMEKIKKEEENKIRRKREEDELVKEMAVQRVELKRRDKAVREQVTVLEERISAESRREALERFGPGPHKVEIALDFPGQLAEDENTGRELPHKFHVELASLSEMPHSVHFFLEQVSRGLWDGCAFVWNPNHLVLASPHVHRRGGDDEAKAHEMVNDDVRREEFRDSGFDRVSFQEYSPEYPHRRYTLGLAGRPGGPNFYVNVKDNAKIHGPGGKTGVGLPGRAPSSDSDDEEEEEDADPCFGKVVAGFDAVDRMHAMPTHGSLPGAGGADGGDEDDGGWKKDALVNDVIIRYAKLLPSGGGGGKKDATTKTTKKKNEKKAKAKVTITGKRKQSTAAADVKQ